MGLFQTTGQIIDNVKIGLRVSATECDKSVLVIDDSAGRIVYILAPYSLYLLPEKRKQKILDSLRIHVLMFVYAYVGVKLCVVCSEKRCAAIVQRDGKAA